MRDTTRLFFDRKKIISLVKIGIFFALYFSFSNLVLAQNPLPVLPQDTAQGKLHVEYSDFGEMILRGQNTIEKFSGNVRLRHGNTVMYADTVLKTGENATAHGHVIIQQGDTVKIFADSLHYLGATKKADFFGDVVLENGRQKLFTTRLQYDLAEKIAHYDVGATMSNGKTQIVSQYGDYYVNEKQAYFEKNVVVTDPDFTLRTDTILFDTETQVATFLAPTRITQTDSKIYTEAGTYDTENEYADFTKNPQFIKGEQRGAAKRMRYDGHLKQFFLNGDAKIEEGVKLATADSIEYNDVTKLTLLTGNAFYRDSLQTIEGEKIRYDANQKAYQISGRTRVSNPPNIIVADRLDFNDALGGGFAEGEVVWQDTAQNLTIHCKRMDYNKKTDYILAVGGEGGRLRPMLTILLDGDTLWLACDTLHSFRKPKLDSTSVDTARILTGHYDVRIFKSDLQALCDSVSFDGNDSLFTFFKQPVLWSDSSQFTADTISMFLKNNKLSQMRLRQNSFILSQPDPDIFNQIKGKNCTAFFQHNKMKRMDVLGNAEAVYFAKDDDGAYMGANRTASPEMHIDFSDGQVEGIRFYGQSTGKFLPMRDVQKDKKAMDLDGRPVYWWDTRRPKSVDDLFALRSLSR